MAHARVCGDLNPNAPRECAQNKTHTQSQRNFQKEMIIHRIQGYVIIADSQFSDLKGYVIMTGA